MAVRVDQNLERMRDVLVHGAEEVAEQLRNADDIDALCRSLTERCLETLAASGPDASADDSRFVASVVRVVGELEQIGALSVRVVNAVRNRDVLAGQPALLDVLLTMADESVDRFRAALRAWAEMDVLLATELATSSGPMAMLHERLAVELFARDAADRVPLALASLAAADALDRITDHSSAIGARIRHLLTGVGT